MSLSGILSNVESLLTSAAILVGGAWAYFHYFRGRVYKPRLEPSITGKVRSEADAHYVLVTALLKNVGLSKVNIQQEGSAVRLYSCKPAAMAQGVEGVQWDHVATFSVFQRHSWIEPGELIEDHQLVAYPKNFTTAVRVDLRIVSSSISWEVSYILPLGGRFEGQAAEITGD